MSNGFVCENSLLPAFAGFPPYRLAAEADIGVDVPVISTVFILTGDDEDTDAVRAGLVLLLLLLGAPTRPTTEVESEGEMAVVGDMSFLDWFASIVDVDRKDSLS